jgi:UDP-glucuronate 4-epimerase
MKVLVTGGAGLIGMQLRRHLAAAGHQVTAIDVTRFDRPDPDLGIVGLDDVAALDALAAERGIEAIVHCAAISGPMMAVGKPMQLVDVNITGTARLLDLARRHGMQRFVYCSSISVYGSTGDVLITEDTPVQPTSVYAATKAACESLVGAFAAEYGLDGVSVRIGRVYGPYRRASCHLNSIIRDANAGRPTQIPADPSFTYHYVHVEDVAGAIRTALEAKALPYRVYNVGGNAFLTMPQIIDIARATIPGTRIEMVPGADDVPDIQAGFSVERIAEDLGWRPRLSLADGLTAYAREIAAGRAAH